MDILFSLLMLVLLVPVILFICCGLYLTTRETPFFSQERPGKGERIFRIYKFKTMTDKKDSDGNLLPDGLRLTKLGSFLRKASLDEIPQLYNVLIGDMSFIGPRPLLPAYLPYYTEEERKRHAIRPGITGLAQVSGRNNLGWDKRLALDIQYYKNLNFFTDLRVVLLTIQKVIGSKDIIVDGSSQTRLDDERRLTIVREKKTVFESPETILKVV